jgi:hypothetical protein
MERKETAKSHQMWEYFSPIFSHSIDILNPRWLLTWLMDNKMHVHGVYLCLSRAFGQAIAACWGRRSCQTRCIHEHVQKCFDWAYARCLSAPPREFTLEDRRLAITENNRVGMRRVCSASSRLICNDDVYVCHHEWGVCKIADAPHHFPCHLMRTKSLVGLRDPSDPERATRRLPVLRRFSAAGMTVYHHSGGQKAPRHEIAGAEAAVSWGAMGI